MALLVGLVGKPNAGKSSFLRALTLVEVKIASYPFTTIKPNLAVAHVTTPCPCKELGVTCNPRNSRCVRGIRFVPVNVIDVAGLVPGAHAGRGLGNKFLDDLRKASCLIHVVDCSGKTDERGEPCNFHDPCEDVRWLEKEIDLWFASIIKRATSRIKRGFTKKEEAIKILANQLSGLGIKKEQIEAVMRDKEVDDLFKEETLVEIASSLREISKPMLIAANKVDLPESEKNLKRLIKEFPNRVIIPCSAEAEIALKLAAKRGLIDYLPGSNDFEVKGKLNEKQREALEKIRELMKKYGSTGVQEALNKAVFELAKYIVVYPVENENKFSDSKGNVLPDAILLPHGSTPRDLASIIHEELARGFICAIDARTKKRLPADYKLKNGDVIKIMARC